MLIDLLDRERERRNRRREDHRIMMSTRMRRIVEEALGITHDETDTDSDEEDEDMDAEDDEDVEGKIEGWLDIWMVCVIY